jgi:hypothetical protein
MPKRPPASDRKETVNAILNESSRPGKVPLRNSFVQQGQRGKNAREGKLAEIVRRGRGSALDQFLLLLAWASAEPYDVKRDSRVWARALGLAQDSSGRATVSRNWRFLRDDLNVVTTQRAGREIRAILLREDGSGKTYSHPGKTKDSPYLTVPFAYWIEEYDQKLHLPGKALLLVALSLPPSFVLPANQAPRWYGLSASTTERGLGELQRAGILSSRKITKKAPLAPEGYTKVNLYSLRKPFKSATRLMAPDVSTEGAIEP